MAANVGGCVHDEDTVYYRLFLDVPREKDATEYLEEQRDTLLAFLGRFCVNYIWQQEPFNLRLHCGSPGNFGRIIFLEILPIKLRKLYQQYV